MKAKLGEGKNGEIVVWLDKIVDRARHFLDTGRKLASPKYLAGLLNLRVSKQFGCGHPCL
jgi:hypothetical protein